MAPSTQICPGCRQNFQPGGYANHLRLSLDPHCRSVRSSFLQTSSDVLPSSSSGPPTPIPPLSSPDIEMMDISNEPEPPAGADPDIPSPNPTTLMNRLDGLDEIQPELDELLTGGPCCLLGGDAIITDSDTDSEISDDDGYDRLSHQDRQPSPPSSVDGGNSIDATATQTASMCTNLFSMSLALTRNERKPEPR